MAKGKGKGKDIEETTDETAGQSPRVVAGDDGKVRMYDPKGGSITGVAVGNRQFKRDSNGCFIVDADVVEDMKRLGLAVRD